MDIGFWGTFAIFIILAVFAFGFIFAVTRMNANPEYSEWREDVEKWNNRNPKKSALMAIPIVSVLFQITNLFSSDPFPSLRVNSEEE